MPYARARDDPPPGSAAEDAAFAALQSRLVEAFNVYRDLPDSDHALVVVPSMTFDRELLEKVAGVDHYEERLLAMLTALRRPRLRLVYCTSTTVPDSVIDYYLHLITGVPQQHSRRRLTMVCCDDASPAPLTQKLLDRPNRIAQIQAAIKGVGSASMICQNSTSLERSLAVAIGIPLYANPPELDHLGSKSGSREIFRAAGVDLPDGFERLRSMDDVADAVARAQGTHSRPDASDDQGRGGLLRARATRYFALDGVDGSSDDERKRQVRESCRSA